MNEQDHPNYIANLDIERMAFRNTLRDTPPKEENMQERQRHMCRHWSLSSI